MWLDQTRGQYLACSRLAGADQKASCCQSATFFEALKMHLTQGNQACWRAHLAVTVVAPPTPARHFDEDPARAGLLDLGRSGTGIPRSLVWKGSQSIMECVCPKRDLTR